MNDRDLRNELVILFNDVKNDRVDVKKAKEMTNTAGKILLSAKIELAYNESMHNGKKIDFLDVE
jgi:hypothetical protein